MKLFLFHFSFFLLLCQSLYCQNQVSYLYNSIGDLTSRSTENGERIAHTDAAPDSLYAPILSTVNKAAYNRKALSTLHSHYRDSANARHAAIKARWNRGNQEAACAVDTSLVLGQIPITPFVTQTGARTYSIPFPTSSGYGFVPEVNLLYNSQSDEGIAGFGWSIGGLSAITVRNHCFYYDGVTRSAIYDGTDEQYVLDGIPLVKNSHAGMNSYDYETVTGNVLARAIRNESNQVVSFRVLFPDGRRAFYGLPDASLPDAVYPLSEVSDIRDNTIKYIYNNQQFPYPIDTILYGKNLEEAIIFRYEDRSSVAIPPSMAGRGLQRSLLLKAIIGISGNQVICIDSLFHEPLYGTHLLTRYSRSRGSDCLNPLRFRYGELDEDLPSVETDTLLAQAPFWIPSFPSAEDLQLIRGKMHPDSYSDGLIILPKFDNYGVIVSVYGFNHYGSLYPPEQSILVYDFIDELRKPDTLYCREGFQDIQAVDIDGDGCDEVVRINYSSHTNDSTFLKFSVFKFNGQAGGLDSLYSFTAGMEGSVRSFGSYGPDRFVYYYGDFRDKGYTQLMIINASINGSNEATRVIDLKTKSVIYNAYTFDPVSSLSDLFVHDIDGDGITEVCEATLNGFDIYRFTNIGLQKTHNLPSPKSNGLNRVIAIGDINGDNYAEFVCAAFGSNGLFCYSYDGKSFTRYSFDNNYFTNLSDEYLLMDVNKDGFNDLIRKRGNDLTVFINDHAWFSQSYVTSLTLDNATELVPANIAMPGGISAVMTLSGTRLDIYDYGYDRSRERLLTSEFDSYANRYKNEYRNITEEDDAPYGIENTSANSLSDGFCKMRFPLIVLDGSLIKTPDGTERNEEWFFYSNAIINRRGLGFCGFQTTRKESLSDGAIGISHIVTETVSDPETFSVPIKTTVYEGSIFGTKLDSTIYRYTKISHPYKKFIPRLDTVIKVDLLAGIRTISRYQYDPYEFVTNQEVIALALDTIPGPGRTSHTYYFRQYGHQIGDADSLWLLGNVITQSSTLFNDTTIQGWEECTKNTYSYRSNQPDTVRHYVGIVDYPEGIVEAENLLSETRYTYDGHGNVTSELTAAYGATDFRGTHYTYDSAGRFLLSKTNAAGLTMTYSGYNLFGKPTSVTDPRGNVTTYTYDNWGNQLTTASPDGQRDTVIRRWAVNDAIGSLYSVTTRSNASPERTTWYNSLGQEVRSAVKRFDGSTVITDKQYSNGGRLLRESLPRRDTAQTVLWNTTGYDTLGRVAAVTAASGAQTLYHYDGRRTTTTREGISSRKTVGADGNVVKSEDTGGEIQYYYRPDGQPDSVRVTAAGTEANPVWATTRFTYDAYGRRTAIIEPSAGTRSDAYTDNADGSSVTVHTTANGTVTTYTDTLGRITRIQRHDLCTPPRPEEPEERSQQTAAADSSLLRSTDFTTDYKYNAYGDLLSARSNNGTSTHYAYDALGRLVTRRDSVPGGHWLQRGFTYDSTGRIASTAYTTGSGISITESHTYTNGYHTKTTAGNTTVWELLSENALGQPTLAKTGTAGRGYSYDAYGFPTGRSIWNDQDELTMDFRYGYNHPTGNMTYREDRMHYISGNTYAREAFTYDALNRLTSMSDNLLAGANARNVTYSRSGNITSMGGSGTFAYADSLHHPYQVTGGSIGGDAWCPVPALTAGYTGYDRPMYVAGESGQVEFTYNDAGERVRAAYVNYSTGETPTIWDRIYIGGQYERETEGSKTRETLWLGGDAYSAPMIFYRENNTGGALYNIGRDVQGSITHLAMVSGDLLKEYSYDPWGRQRNPDTHAFPTYGPLPGGGDDEEEEERALTTIIIPVLHRGYCGHEYIEPFGLINMNARLYDPFNGRFFSPDPYVQAPDFSQNFNRYAYCLNNPLKYEDESGEFIVTAIIIGASIGAIIGGFVGYDMAQKAGATGIVAVGYVLGGAFVGAVSGGASAGIGAAVSVGLAAVGVGGFIGGAISGGIAGAIGGAINGYGMSRLAGGSSQAAWEAAGTQALMGAATGLALGGLSAGSIAASEGKTFFTGSSPKTTVPTSKVVIPSPEAKIENPGIPKPQALQEGIPPKARVTLSQEQHRKAVDYSIALFKDQGGTNVVTEVSFRDPNSGTLIKADFVGTLDKRITIVEVKSSATAPLTKNQSIVYPKMEVMEPIVPVGTKASQFFGQQTGQAIDNYQYQLWRGTGGAFKP